MKRVAFITGMQTEARCLGVLTRYLPPEQRPYIHCAGPGPEQAAIACEHIDKQTISGIASIGVAGGLDPALAAGTILVPSALVTKDNQLIGIDPQWRANLSATLPFKPPSTLHMGVNVAITNTKDKERLFQEYKANAVDMESHILGKYAKERGLPFILIRIVADTAKHSIPEAALAGLNKTGSILPFQVLRRLVSNPGQIPSMLQLARNSKAAMNALKTIPRPAIEVLCQAKVVD